MAKSFDKNNFIDDDNIRQALKTELKSIQPSKGLKIDTIQKCSNEITQNKPKFRSIKFVPWVYKLGAPIAASALVLLLVLNSNNLLVKLNTNESTPQGARYDSMASAESAKAPAASICSTQSPQNYANDRAATPDVGSAEPGAPEQGMDQDDISIKGLVGMSQNAHSLESLKSAVNHTKNENVNTDEYIDAFVHIVRQYNIDKEEKYVLDASNITRIHTLIGDGVNAATLLSSESYRDLLNDEGYWALPLIDDKGVLKQFLRVNILSESNAHMTVSSSDLIYEYKQEKYLITPILGVGEDFVTMFIIKTLVSHIEEHGFKLVSEPVIVDINRGNDFIAFTQTSDTEIAVPFFISSGMFGLENSKVYTVNEVFRLISEYLN